METEIERDRRGQTGWSGSLMPSVDGCFCLVVRGGELGGQESPKLATALPCEKDKWTPSCQLKFKHSFTMHCMGAQGGREGGGGGQC